MKKVKVITGLIIEDVIVPPPPYEQAIPFFGKPVVRFTDSPDIGVGRTQDYSDSKVDILAAPIKEYVLNRASCSVPYDLQERSERCYIAVNPKLDSILSDYFLLLNDEIKNLEARCKFFESDVEDLERMLGYSRSVATGLEANLETIKSASLWQRIKWVFTGIKVDRYEY
jgi:hypothetical protein